MNCSHVKFVNNKCPAYQSLTNIMSLMKKKSSVTNVAFLCNQDGFEHIFGENTFLPKEHIIATLVEKS